MNKFEFIVDAERFLEANGFAFWKRVTKYGTDEKFSAWRKITPDGSWCLASLFVDEFMVDNETVSYTVRVILH